MNSTLISILRVILIPILLYVLTLCKMEQNRKEEANAPVKEYILIRQPKYYSWFGHTIILFLTAAHTMTICFAPGNERIFSLVFALLETLIGFIVYSFLQWKILLFRDKEFFQLTDFFGRTHTIHYTDCMSCQYHRHIIVVLNHIKPFFIGAYAAQAGLLVAALRFHGVGTERS